MPCNPADNNLNVPGPPGIPIPGFGIPFAPIQLPVPGFDLPEGFPESILDLLNNLNINWPGGPIGPQIDNFAATLLKALMNLFSQLMPWLSLYNFFIALLNMILCIIDVLCALTNPFKLVRAVRRLITECLPPFLNLFPWLALIAMIIALILLLLALIAYIIARILEIIRDLLQNLALLSRGLTLQDAESTVAVAFKIASLLCIIENLMAMFGAIAVIFAIIESLSNIGGFSICGGGSNDNGSGCCSDDVCPPFIRNNPDGIQGIQGRLVYHKAIIDPDRDNNPLFSNLFPGTQSNSLRREMWQFVNDDPNQEYPFSDIIRSYKDTTTQRGSVSGGSRTLSTIYEDGDIFWPEGQTYTKETTLRRAPYNVDITIDNYDPMVFDVDDEVVKGGIRKILIKNAIVDSKPYIGVRDETGSISEVDEDDQPENLFGTLSIVGGKAYEEDEETPIVDGDGNHLGIEELIHQNAIERDSIPNFNDGYDFDDIEFTLNINHGSLMSYNLTVAGCIPDIAIETQQLNDRTDFRPVFNKIGALPDINGTQECVANIISKLRENITQETAAAAQTDIIACLEQLKDEAEDTFCRAFFAGVDLFESTFTLDPDLQFITRPIEVSLTLRDKGGIDISKNIPESCITDILDSLGGEATLGELSDFTYDRSNGVFLANITSDISGDGELRITWQNNFFQEILNSDNPDIDTAVQERFLSYTFVGTRGPSIPESDTEIRRDATDVANNLEGN